MSAQPQLPELTGGARFSPDRRHRYSLWRATGTRGSRTVVFVMLNPSVADADDNDPTVTRVVNYAKEWGYARLVVVNLFSRITSYPKELGALADLADDETDRVLLAECGAADLVVAAWGRHGGKHRRDSAVLRLLAENGIRLHVLGFTKSGRPLHPLMQKKDLKPVPWHYAAPTIDGAGAG